MNCNHKWVGMADVVKCRLCGETMTGDEYTAMVSAALTAAVVGVAAAPCTPCDTVCDPENAPACTQECIDECLIVNEEFKTDFPIVEPLEVLHADVGATTPEQAIAELGVGAKRGRKKKEK